MIDILQLNYLQKLSTGPDPTLFPDRRGFEPNSKALKNPDKIRLGDALCSGRSPSAGHGPALLGSEQMSCNQGDEQRKYEKWQRFEFAKVKRNFSIEATSKLHTPEPESDTCIHQPGWRNYWYHKLVLMAVRSLLTTVEPGRAGNKSTFIFFSVCSSFSTVFNWGHPLICIICAVKWH